MHQSAIQYVEEALGLFFRDAPDSEFQRGYLAALLLVYHEGFGAPDSTLLKAGEALLAMKTQDAIRQTA